MPDFYILDVESTGALARIGVNGAPLALDATGEGQVITRQINEWIMPKDNALSVFLQWPPGKEYKSGVATAKAVVYRNDPGSPTAKPAPEGNLAQFGWPARLLPEVYPFPFNVPFVVHDPPPALLWTQAEEIKELSAQDKTDIVALVAQLRAAILAGKPQDALALCQYKFDDVARANGGDLTRARQNAAVQLGVLCRLKEPASPVFDLRRAVFQIACKNKVVCVTSGPADEPIVLREKDNTTSVFAIDVFVSRIKGVWTIVR